MNNAPSLTLLFIVEPPRYQYYACYLAASIREHLPKSVNLIGYCPEHRFDELDRAAIETLRRMGCPVRPFRAEARFSPDYPHGNKILAALEPCETDFAGFVDSDVLFLNARALDGLLREGCVSASVAASMYWAPQSIWTDIYGAFEMEVPKERVRLMRDTRFERIPYYSSGFVIYPRHSENADHASFPETWYETAQRIDAITGLENKRPYLDQMSLPIAIKRAGMKWNQIPEEQHYILGGTLRGQPFPSDQGITTVHYRHWDILKENKLAAKGYEGLQNQVGVRQVSRIWEVDAPPGITEN